MFVSSPVFDEAIADFAAAYAEQNQRDYEAATLPAPQDPDGVSGASTV